MSCLRNSTQSPNRRFHDAQTTPPSGKPETLPALCLLFVLYPGTVVFTFIKTDPLVTLFAPQQIIDDNHDCHARQSNRKFKQARHEYHRQNIAGGITEKFKNLAVKYSCSYNQTGQYPKPKRPDPKPKRPDPTPIIRFILLSETLAHAMQLYLHNSQPQEDCYGLNY
jgi:hypothetical protein